jgi:hypothetical protein
LSSSSLSSSNRTTQPANDMATTSRTTTAGPSQRLRTVRRNVWPWSWAMCPTRLDIPSVIGVCTTRLGRRRGPAPEHDRMAVVLSGPTNPNACPSPRLNDRPSRATRARPGGSVSGIPTCRPTHSGSHPDVRGLTRTLAAGPVGGVRPGEEPGVLLGSYRVGLPPPPVTTLDPA